MKHKLALAIIAKPTDKEAIFLARLLGNVADYVDKIFITITGENKEVERVAKAFNAEISHFEWINDFAAARNYNFSQVPKEYDYIMWADCDDMFKGLKHLRKIIDKNLNVDGFIMWYFYAWNEYKKPIVVHRKTQIVRNDGTFKWAGELHEDFDETRSHIMKLIKDINRLHLSDEEHFNDAKERNLEVAKNQYQKNPDDPRSYWNLFRAYTSLSDYLSAEPWFYKFIENSGAEDEKYIAYVGMAEMKTKQKEYTKALEMVRYAIGMKPEFPDAYLMAGHIYFEMESWENARDYYLRGITKQPPYYSIIVHNPREYDYIPLMQLAKVYWHLHLPQMSLPCFEGCLKIYPDDENLKALVRDLRKDAKIENEALEAWVKLSKIKDKQKLKQKLDNLPIKIKSHPKLCNLKNVNFIKEESSGRDLVFYCGVTQHEWTPEIAKKKGVGGSEEAIIHLSQKLADKGWNVVVYNNCGYKELKFGKVTFKPFWSWNYRDKQDITVIWRHPMPVDFEINSKVIILDMHDALKAGELTEKRLQKIDKIFVKSQFHRSLYDKISDDKFVVAPNGITPEDFKYQEKDPYLMLNTSSPDRALSSLVEVFPKIKKAVPQARLVWVYGWKVFDVVHQRETKIMEWKENLIKRMAEVGVEGGEMVNHQEVAELYKKAGLFVYPTEFAEIDCISYSKAMAAGCYPIATDFAALGEKSFGVQIHSDKTKDDWCQPRQWDFALKGEKLEDWTKEVINKLKNPPTEEEKKQLSQIAREKFNWGIVAEIWDKNLWMCLNKQT